ncbi:hypothetical protein GPECTOR_9g747 [Gonium pectorale]|uniref:Dynamin N-terminal domain-containing protein n=1 Tax=Gonium pectorale TaxID=33097 RepID=A0A150GSB7_GONPE|nr:hypothetical protein GPECTOR_9g747 [Gonium pectorale]|eukprot:KXZ52701.1 hypothetical protein GPECTOR_9g747 [Gonium pectorale]
MLSIRRAQPTAERFPLSATGPGEAATAKLQPASPFPFGYLPPGMPQMTPSQAQAFMAGMAAASQGSATASAAHAQGLPDLHRPAPSQTDVKLEATAVVAVGVQPQPAQHGDPHAEQQRQQQPGTPAVQDAVQEDGLPSPGDAALDTSADVDMAPAADDDDTPFAAPEDEGPAVPQGAPPAPEVEDAARATALMDDGAGSHQQQREVPNQRTAPPPPAPAAPAAPVPKGAAPAAPAAKPGPNDGRQPHGQRGADPQQPTRPEPQQQSQPQLKTLPQPQPQQHSQPQPQQQQQPPTPGPGNDLAAEALSIIDSAQAVLAPRSQGVGKEGGSSSATAAAVPVAGVGMTAVWLKELEDLRRMCGVQPIVIGIVGTTGAGKSSLLNALLGREGLLPTSGMHASTACAIEVSYHDSHQYKGSVEFMTEAELHTFVGRLLSDATDEDGGIKMTEGECSNRSDAGAAQAMLEAVYGRSVIRAPGLSLEKLKGVQNTLTKLLGKKLALPPTSNEKAFRQEIGKYVESSGKAGGLQAWPLVKVCKIQGRFKTLPRNAILVDLPGVRDTNEARAAVAEHYLRRCDAVWVAAPITRAVNDKTAKDLLDSSFRRRLVMEGQLDALTFICTKSDDIEASDTRRDLGDAGVCERAGVAPGALEELDAVLEAREAAEEAADAAVERLQRQLRSMKGRWTAAFKKADAACAALEDLPSGQRPEGFRELRRAVAPPPGLSRDEAGPRKRRRGGPRGGGGRAAPEGSGDEEDEMDASECQEDEEDGEEEQAASDVEASSMDDGSEEGGEEEEDEVEDESDGGEDGGSEGEEVSDEQEECSDADAASEEPSEPDDDEEDDWEDGPLAKSRGGRSRPQAGAKRKRPVSKTLAAKSPPRLMEELRREVDKIKQARSEHKALQPQLKAARRDQQAASARFTAEQRKLAAICARARNAFSREQLRRDFHEGLAEVAAQAGDRSRAQQHTAIQLPVFCVSARDAQKLEGRCKRDGPVAAFSRLEDTEVPALRRHLRDAADAARLRAQKRLALGVLGFLNSAGGTLLSQRLDASHRAMQALQSAFECELAALRHRLGAVAGQLDTELRAELGRGLSPRLGLGAQLAAQGALARARRWAAALHPMTYRATVNRHGFHKTTALASKNLPDFRDGVVDFNGQLASPILDAVSTCWDELWNRRLGQLLSDVERRGLAAVEAAAEGVRRRLLAELGASAEVQLAAIDSVHEEVKRHESRKLQLRAAEALAEALDGARGLSADRHVERAVQSEMQPLYEEQRADRGAGVCRRNQVAMETFLAQRARGMMAGAAGVLERGAWELLAELQSRLRQALAELHRGASARFALLW